MFKNWIIHLLGGYTKEDLSSIYDKQSYLDAQNNWTLIHVIMGIRNLYLFSKELYGKPADDWCRRVYSEIEKLHDDAIEREFKE